MIARCLILLILSVLPLMASAQEAPLLRMEVAETEAIPGQPLSVRITVLVPTYMPRAPVWPGYEAPNLLVQLPEKSTTPVSEQVNGQTWAGVSRRYVISAMIPGTFTLPEAEVTVTWADPDTNEPRQTALRTQRVTLRGVVPEGAEGLDPFVAATGLTLKQEIEGDPSAMVPGDSVIRTITATIEGSSPMFLPPLSPPVDVAGLRVYPDEPVLEMRDARGVPSGTRTERVTLLAEGGGQGAVPDVSLEWYNLDTGQIETAQLDGFDVSVEGPPVAPETNGPWDSLRAVLLGAAAVAGLALIVRLVWPGLRRRAQEMRARRLGSEAYAWRVLLKAVATRDMAALYPALDLWAARCGLAGGAGGDADVARALLGVGRARYGTAGAAPDAGAWRDLDRALRGLRQRHRSGRHRARAELAALN